MSRDVARDIPFRLGTALGALTHRVTIDFALYRTGELRLWIGADLGGAPSMEAAQAVVRQACFFVRDLAHTHTHHDPGSDQLSAVEKFRPLPEGRDDLWTEGKWRRETLWGLSRVVEELTQKRGVTGHRQALGVLAYADAFQSTFLSWVRTPDTADGLQPTPPDNITAGFDFAHYRESVKAVIDTRAANQSVGAQMWATGVAILLSVASLLSSVIATRNTAIDDPGERRAPAWPEAALALADATPLSILAAAFTAFLLVYTLIVRPQTVSTLIAATSWLWRFIVACGLTIARRLGGDRATALGASFAINAALLLLLAWGLVSALD